MRPANDETRLVTAFRAERGGEEQSGHQPIVDVDPAARKSQDEEANIGYLRCVCSAEESRQAARYERFVQSGVLPDDESASGVWHDVMDAARWTELGLGAAPKTTSFKTAVPGTVSHARLVEAQLRAHVAGHDVDRLSELVARCRRAPAADARSEVVSALTLAWHAWNTGEPIDATVLAGWQRSATEQQMASLSIELMSVLALVDLRSANRESALRRARIASRMGRSEGIPYAEILANLVLARVRRMHGKPHLALRILRGLRRFASPMWQGWIAWEALMAGRWGEDTVPLWPLLQAAAAGDAQDLHRAVGELKVDALPRPLQEDARATIELLSRGDGAEKSLALWRDGRTDALPDGLTGLAFALPSPGSAAFHTWVAVDGQSARRVSHLEIELAKAEGFRIIDRPHQPRADTGVAMLALASGPIAKEEYFKRLYGFPFDAALHAATFSMHLGRVRERVESHATLIAGDDRLQLVNHDRVLLPDPRCQELLTQRALRVLAEHPGGLSTRALAALLGSTLRTAQRATHALVDDGAIEVKPKGRGTVYSVEDSTFSEPTMSRTFEADSRRSLRSR